MKRHKRHVLEFMFRGNVAYVLYGLGVWLNSTHSNQVFILQH